MRRRPSLSCRGPPAQRPGRGTRSSRFARDPLISTATPAVERLARFCDQRVQVGEPLRARTECLDREARALADCEQPLRCRPASRSGRLPRAARRRCRRAPHLAEHEPARAAEAAERIEARACSELGIGVVRVVDEERAVERGLELEPSCDALHRREARDDLVELDTGCACGGRCAQCIAQVVQAAERKRRRLACRTA